MDQTILGGAPIGANRRPFGDRCPVRTAGRHTHLSRRRCAEVPAGHASPRGRPRGRVAGPASDDQVGVVGAGGSGGRREKRPSTHLPLEAARRGKRGSAGPTIQPLRDGGRKCYTTGLVATPRRRRVTAASLKMRFGRVTRGPGVPAIRPCHRIVGWECQIENPKSN